MTDTTRIKPGILPSGTTTPIPGAVIEPPPSLPVPVETVAVTDMSRRRSGIRWGIALGVSALLLIAGVVVIDAVLWLDGLFARSAWLGAAAAALFGSVLVALVGFIGGEYRNLLRLRSAQAIREQGYLLAQASGRFEGRGFMNDLLRLTWDTTIRALYPGEEMGAKLLYDGERAALPDRYAVIEVKAAQTLPHWLVELIQRASLVPESISKYVHAVNALGLSRKVLATC